MSPDKTRKKRQRGSSLTAQPPPRKANRIFYAVAEGRVTEYDYLTMLQNSFSERCSFRIDMPKPGSRSDDMDPSRVAKFALAVAEEDARRPKEEQYTEIWVLLDRDEHVGVVEALDALTRHPKIKVAFSHPSFDFWLYLHFTLYDVPQGGSNTEIHRLLSQCDGFLGFGSKDKKITKTRADELSGRIRTAYTNARNLDKRCTSGKCTHQRSTKPCCGPLDQDPSSSMWRLLESLGVSPFLV